MALGQNCGDSVLDRLQEILAHGWFFPGHDQAEFEEAGSPSDSAPSRVNGGLEQRDQPIHGLGPGRAHGPIAGKQQGGLFGLGHRGSDRQFSVVEAVEIGRRHPARRREILHGSLCKTELLEEYSGSR